MSFVPPPVPKLFSRQFSSATDDKPAILKRDSSQADRVRESRVKEHNIVDQSVNKGLKNNPKGVDYLLKYCVENNPSLENAEYVNPSMPETSNEEVSERKPSVHFETDSIKDESK